MKLGWKELKAELEGVKWYERKTVRDESSLTPEQVKYIRSWSISPLGYGQIFYVCGRVLPDIATVYIVTYLYSEAYEPFISRFLDHERYGWAVSLSFAFLGIIFSLAVIYNTYFLFRHGRRLSWNRGRYVFSGFGGKREIWKSVQELQDSEKRFVKYSTVPSLVILMVVILLFIYNK